jgi:hypothetical protein
MAEIHIQKKGAPIWPWIVGILLLVLIIWAVAAWWRTDTDAPQTTRPPADRAPMAEQLPPRTTPGDAVPAAVREYTAFGTQPGQIDAEKGLDHEYTATGLRRLVAALDEVVEQETVNQQPLEERLARIREQADRITKDPHTLSHARMVREALTEAAMLIGDVRQRRAPDQPAVEQHVTAARTAAGSIDPDTPLLEQHDIVRRFFRESAEALHQLATTAVAR